MSINMHKMWGRAVPVGVLAYSDNKLERNRYRYRGPELAIRDKLKVLREFGIVDSRNEEDYEQKMRKLIEDNPGADFDRLLDGFARGLISKKLGG